MAAQIATTPTTHRALVLTSRDQPLTVESLPTPAAETGSAVIRIIAAGVLSYSGDLLTGKRPYAFPTPFVPGASAIGRIAAVGPDATLLAPGQLVLFDCMVRGRDDPSAAFLHGISEGHSERSRRLMHGPWRDSTYAEYARVPLENCLPLDEARLIGALGYREPDLLEMTSLLVPFGGLADIAVCVGDTVIVAPATGTFGGAAVRAALAMGAGRILALGRNTDALARLEGLSPRVVGMPITSDAAALRAHGPADVFFDISPPMAAGSPHLRECIDALRHGGRVSLMGGMRGDFAFTYNQIVRRGLSVKGTWMYTREQALQLVKMVESGLLPIGEKAGTRIEMFGLGEWKEAFESAAKNAGPTQLVALVP